MVEFNHVTKIYDSLISAVYDVSFKVEEGEFAFLIGPSGSGKTTIIKMLIRDEVPSEGNIYFNNSDITKVSRSKVYKLRREIGVVFQDFKLVPDKTAFENVAFAMEAAGKKNKEIKDTVPYVLDIVGLSNRMNAFPRQLSGGEQQRVAIARAIANNPKILIADEPTGNLDPASSWDIVQVLTKINNWGTTVIMSTHGTDIVNSLNKRVIQMEKGRVIRDDNKGQYELIHPELEAPKQEGKGEPKAKESKKKVFQVKIKKDSESDEKLEAVSPILPEVAASKKHRSFSKLFGIFHRESHVSKEKEQENIMEILADVPKIPANPEVQKIEDDVVKLDDKPVMKFDLGESAKNVQKPDTETMIKPEVKSANNFEDVSVDDMNLPKSVKSDLKTSGYKTVQDIVNLGVDELAKNLVIDPEEVILVSKEIKKISEQKN